MIKVSNAVKKFQSTLSLNNVTVNFDRGDRVVMMGPNGAGKTTLVRSILGFYRLDKGAVEVDGFNPSKDRTKALRNISFIPQLPPPIKLSLKELIEYVQKTGEVDLKKLRQNCDKMALDLDSNLDKSFFKLSGGMKQKLLISIALSKNSSIFIFDEPTANLDPQARDRFTHLLGEIKEDSTMLFISHRIDEVKDLINRSIYMDLGEIVKDEKVKYEKIA